MTRRVLTGLLLIGAALCPCSAHGQQDADFTVTDTSLHAEQKRAEICFTFSRPIDTSARQSLAASVVLERDGKRVPIHPRDLSLIPSEICLQQLEHRHRYKIAINKLRSKDGKALASPLSASFTVPDRKPSLGLVAPGNTRTLIKTPIWTPDQSPVIKSVNIKKATLVLYRFPDRANFAEAAKQMEQINLAPSESLYLAKQKGKIVWQSDLVFGDQPNVEQTLPAPMPPAKELMPGLYFLAVSPASDTLKGPSLFTGQWLLISTVDLTAMKDPAGYYAFVHRTADSQPVHNASVQVLSEEGATLAEAPTNAKGIAYLEISPDRRDKAFLISVLGREFETDILNLQRLPPPSYQPSSGTSTLSIDERLYKAGETLTATLTMQDKQGRFLSFPESALKLLRPDFSLAGEIKTPTDAAAPVQIGFSLPFVPAAGEWHLLWQQSNGAVFAQKTFRLSPDGQWPKVTLNSDQGTVSLDGKTPLSIKTVNDSNKALTWRSGMLTAQLQRPRFAAWKDYTFGVNPGAYPAADPSPGKSFITGANGTAKIVLPARFPAESARTSAAEFIAIVDGVISPATLSLPLENDQGWIGVRPGLEGGNFPENSTASFEIIALNADAVRKSWNDLYYHIYEEGRHFDWFPADGHWDYRPLPQHHRIGGGHLSVPGDAPATLVWPVTAGHYALEITNSVGDVLAQYDFQAGGARAPAAPSTEGISISAEVDAARSPHALSVKLSLDRPAVVSLLAGDQLIREALHLPMQEGERTVEIPSFSSDLAKGRIVAFARFQNGKEAIAAQDVDLRPGAEEMPFSATITPDVKDGSSVIVNLQLAKKTDFGRPAFTQATMFLVDNKGAVVTTTDIPAQSFNKDGKAALRFGVKEKSGTLIANVNVWDDQHFSSKRLHFPLKPAFDIAGRPPSILHVGDQGSFFIEIKNKGDSKQPLAYTLSMPEGLRSDTKAKSSFAIKPGQTQRLNVDFQALLPGQGDVRLDLGGPGDQHENLTWPIVIKGDGAPHFRTERTEMHPEQMRTLSKSPAGFVVISPAPLPDVPRELRLLLSFEPFTTEELARWIDATDRWRNTIISLKLENEFALAQLATQRLNDLRKRQNNDGSFSPWPGATASDIDSTASALAVLNTRAPLEARNAANWLHRKLENTWFDESERSSRARAFLALARTDLADLSALRYFADTSRDKPLPPYVPAQLALAFNLYHDDEGARFWLDRARMELGKLAEARSADVWRLSQWLAENALYDRQELATLLKGVAGQPLESRGQTTAMLRTLDFLLERTDTWKIFVDEQDRQTKGLLILSLDGKQGQRTLRNTSPDTHYLLTVRDAQSTAKNGDEDLSPTSPAPLFFIKREARRLDGTPVDSGESLEQGATYVLLVRAQANKEVMLRESAFVLTQPSSSAFTPQTAGRSQADALRTLWNWLPNDLVDPMGVTTTIQGASFALPSAREWSVAYLFTAGPSGRYTLPAPQLRDLQGEPLPVAISPMKWQIK